MFVGTGEWFNWKDKDKWTILSVEHKLNIKEGVAVRR